VGGGDGGWQLAELHTGFDAVLPRKLLAPLQLSAPQLMAIVCRGSVAVAPDGGAAGAKGAAAPKSADFSIRVVFRVVEDPELIECGLLREALWAVLDAWPVEQKRLLLKFCTGSDRLPAPGTEVLSVQMPFSPTGDKETRAMVQMLPQAHTCDNILELPNYYAALVARGVQETALKAELRSTIQDRFMLAVSSCDGYGLDEAGGGGEAAFVAVRPPGGVVLASPRSEASPGLHQMLASGDAEDVVTHENSLESIESMDDLLSGMDSPKKPSSARRNAPLEMDIVDIDRLSPPSDGAGTKVPDAEEEWAKKKKKKKTKSAPPVVDTAEIVALAPPSDGSGADKPDAEEEGGQKKKKKTKSVVDIVPLAPPSDGVGADKPDAEEEGAKKKKKKSKSVVDDDPMLPPHRGVGVSLPDVEDNEGAKKKKKATKKASRGVELETVQPIGDGDLVDNRAVAAGEKKGFTQRLEEPEEADYLLQELEDELDAMEL